MSLDEEALEAVANGGSIDLEKWAGIVVPLLERLEYNVYNVFPMPKVPPSSYNPQPRPPPSESNAVPESSNKENTAPGDLQSPQQPQQTSGSPPSNELVPDSQPQPSSPRTNDVLPPPLALLLGSIRSSVQSFFVAKPPHTIQRLAELILRPTAHYKTLPAYLRAVDRVVSVTSGADVFPFSAPPSTSAQSNGLVHPTNSAGAYLTPDYTSGLGSDESLGGALLTPIPWLTNASFEGGDGGIADAQGLTTIQPQEVEAATTATAEGDDEAKVAFGSPPADTSEEVPHARGPPVVGVEDLGLQDGKGVEMTLSEPIAQDGASDPSSVTSTLVDGESVPADKDGDIVLDDSTPKEETKADDTTAAVTKTGDEQSEEAGDSAPAAQIGKEE
ncbi:hypothetical protein PMG11_04719 [Penicillium brasilianum]|uniref:Protein phosphatase 4 core regulatory subunit R2 n=1 Tax=Penicillium brasilianum TaxID=104259 RepID=A0A0F7VGQ0_PENBI|nr:hypothetical protein PMG11_04719 [Penicillium brasilianum]